MATNRPAKCYRWDSPAYTRVSRTPSNSYITGIPGAKIIHFDMGNKTGEFDTSVQMIVEENIQITHNALESARIMIQKKLEREVGVANYHFKVNVFPHHVLRNNVTATGAGADRVSQGMRKAFGKPIGRAARVRKGQPVFTVSFNHTEARQRFIKKTLRIASNKLPGSSRLRVNAGGQL
jgi:large subunit ribosomal protein L10e